MRIMAIDPAPQLSGFCVWDTAQNCATSFGKIENDLIFAHIGDKDVCVCERIRSYGMPAGAELFETCEWSGRFQEAAKHCGIPWHWMERKTVKLHLCGQTRAKDGNIRQAIIDRFGGRDAAIGKKAAPGPLYGVSGDVWAALAVCLTWADMREGA